MDQPLGKARILDPVPHEERPLPDSSHAAFAAGLDLFACLMVEFAGNPLHRPALSAQDIAAKLRGLAEHAQSSCSSCSEVPPRSALRRFAAAFAAYRKSAHYGKAASLGAIRYLDPGSDEGSDADWRYPLEELVAALSPKLS